MCPAPATVANVKGPALRVTPATLPSTVQSRNGFELNASCPVHSSANDIRSFPTWEVRHPSVGFRVALKNMRAYPVTYPVIRSDIQKSPNTSFEQRGNVELCGEGEIHCCLECIANFIRA